MVEEFKTYLRCNLGYSMHTAEAYGKDLHEFARWMIKERKGVRWSDVTTDEIEKFIRSLDADGKKATTINRHVSSIRQAYNWMMKNGKVEKNPARYVSSHKTPKTMPNTIPPLELKNATATATGTLRVMLLILASTGVRVQEMLDIEKSDVEETEQRILIHGKGKKDRYVYFNEATIKEIVEYAAGRPNKIFGDIDQRSVRTAVWNHLRKHSRARQLSPHAIRHTYATEMAKHGYNETTIATILGHENTKTTRKYIDLAQMNVKQAQLEFQFVS